MAPVLSEDDLPEDWEEAATADEASHQGLPEAESVPEHAERVGNEGVSSARDDEPLDETPYPERTSPDPVGRCITGEAILGLPATARPAHAAQEETVAAAASPTNDQDAGTAADKLLLDGSQEVLLAADLAAGKQQSLVDAAQDSESSAGKADAATQSASDLEASVPLSAGSLQGSVPLSAGSLQGSVPSAALAALEDTLLVCDAHAAEEVAPSAERDSQPTGVPLDPGEEESQASAAS